MASPPRLHPAALANLDEPVRRYFAHALGAGARRARTTLRMTGRIDLGVWLGFTAVWEGDARSFTWTAASGPGRARIRRVTSRSSRRTWSRRCRRRELRRAHADDRTGAAGRPARHVRRVGPGHARRAGGYPRPIAAAVSDDAVRALLSTPRTWAVVGCSPRPQRDSHRIADLLQRRGNRILPINPDAAGDTILGRRCHAALTDLPDDARDIDVVDIFRRADAAGAHVDEAIMIGARAVWMQLGVIDHAAADRARAAGLEVVMDRCPAIEIRRLGLG